MIQTRQAEAAGWWVFNPLLPVARMGVFRYAQVAHRAWRRCVSARCAHTGPPVREACPRLCGGTSAWRKRNSENLGLSPRVRGNPFSYDFGAGFLLHWWIF